MRAAKFQTYAAVGDDGKPMCEVHMITAESIPACVDLSPPLPSDRSRRLARWPDGVLAVVNVGANARALQVAYREGMIPRELLRMQFEAEHAIERQALRNAVLAAAPAGGTA